MRHNNSKSLPINNKNNKNLDFGRRGRRGRRRGRERVKEKVQGKTKEQALINVSIFVTITENNNKNKIIKNYCWVRTREETTMEVELEGSKPSYMQTVLTTMNIS